MKNLKIQVEEEKTKKTFSDSITYNESVERFLKENPLKQNYSSKELFDFFFKASVSKVGYKWGNWKKLSEAFPEDSNKFYKINLSVEN